MKHLQDYIEDAQTALFNECGAFFAFSNQQFNEGKKEGKKYVNMGAGMICEEEHVERLINGLHDIHTKGIAQDIEENTIEGVIKRELYNHEAFYTGDISDTVDSLGMYPVTREQVYAVYQSERATAYANE